MRKLYLSFLLVFMAGWSYAQNDKCGTNYFTYEQIQQIRESAKQYQSSRRTAANQITSVPVQFHFIHPNDPSHAEVASIEEANMLLAWMNHDFEPADLTFFFKEAPIYVNHTASWDNFTSAKEEAMAAESEADDALNIYFVKEIQGDVAGYARAPLPNKSSNRIVMEHRYAGDQGVVSHEVGHYFSLPHTFQNTEGGPNGNLSENVARSGSEFNADAAGDFISDTHADPGVDENRAQTDRYGRTYTPPTDNLMSYYSSSDIMIFTPGQYEQVKYGVSRRKFFMYEWARPEYSWDASPASVNAVENLSAEFAMNKITLSWDDVADNETGYIIYRSRSASSGFRALPGKGLAPGAETYTDDYMLEHRTKYYYKIVPSNGDPLADWPVIGIETPLMYCLPPYPFTCIFKLNGVAVSNSQGEPLMSNINNECNQIGTGRIGFNNVNYILGDYSNSIPSFDMTPGEEYSFSFNLDQGQPGNISIWIDFDQNGVYNTDEIVFQNISVVDGSENSVLIPANANTGLTKMRIRYEIAGIQTPIEDPCGIARTPGETEEYAVNILGDNPACNILSVSAGEQSACEEVLNTYTQSIVVEYKGAPTDGYLNVNGQHFPITGSPQVVELVDLDSDGIPVDVMVGFSDNDDCEYLVTELFTAPESCMPKIIKATAMAGSCNSQTNLHNQEIVIEYENEVAGGSLLINGKKYATTGSPQTVIFEDIESNGQEHIYEVAFLNYPSRVTTTSVNARNSCKPQCNFVFANIVATGECVDGLFELQLFTQYKNAPAGDLIINGQVAPINKDALPDAQGNIFQFVTMNFPARGGNMDLEVYFSEEPSCRYFEEQAIESPASCAPLPEIVNASIGNQSACDQATNTYSQEVIISYNNPPIGGKLKVNSQEFDIASSPQTILLEGLVSDGALVDLNVEFASDQQSLVVFEDLFTAPSDCFQSNCNITSIALGERGICDPLHNTYTQNVIVSYQAAPATGHLVVNGQNYAIEASPMTVTLMNLPSDGTSIDVAAFFEEDPNCKMVETSLFTGPNGCDDNTPICSISNITAGIQSACDPLTNSYSQDIIIAYEEAPSTGGIIINGQRFDLSASPMTITLTNLLSDGGAVDVEARFEDNKACKYESEALFNAPFDCSPSCNIIDVAKNGRTQCNPTTNTFKQKLTITYDNAPSSGKLNVNGQEFDITQSPQQVQLIDLPSDGLENDVTVFFTADQSCSYTKEKVFKSRNSCLPACSITGIASGIQSVCDPLTNTYSQEVIIAYEDAPATGGLVVNGEVFALTASPMTVILSGLTSDGNAVDVDAHFENELECKFESIALFTAPVNCTPVCSISEISLGVQSICDPLTNTYSQEVIISYEDAPATGGLVVNGEVFALTASPMSVMLTGLTSNGNVVDVEAHFESEIECKFESVALFTAPVDCTPSCNILDVAKNGRTQCDPATNTFKQKLTITYENAPSSGKLNVNGQEFEITSSPQKIQLVDLESNGLQNDVTVYFTENSACSFTKEKVFKSRNSCLPVCSITGITTGIQSVCDPLTNTYSQEVIIVYEDAPATGGLVVNGEVFALTASPMTVTLTGLISDGNTVDVDAHFENDLECKFESIALFTAPVDCTPSCNILDVAKNGRTQCDPATNTFKQKLTITYENAPTSGKLNVNGQEFEIKSSPQKVQLVDLESNGLQKDVTVYFTENSACSFTKEKVFKSRNSCLPKECLIKSVELGATSECNISTNTFSQEVVVSFDRGELTEILELFVRFGLEELRYTYTLGAGDASEATVLLEGLPSNSNLMDLEVRFVEEQSCSLLKTEFILAKSSCRHELVLGDDRISILESITISPNPASDLLRIDGLKSQMINLDFYDLSGRLIYTVSAISEDRIDISEIKAGIYILEIQTKQGLVKERLVVK
ncbi:zinc-dependent metalloprotease [Aureibacter tunicatorum]|uniref:Secreted protein (Por secretion system target) n=1 Tax=Aureibacter tunicatorum TaxID=866807 RepID=A0AAE4BUU9_9BACT|nr:zinc-dependent metalloprotease [Aureibacter tunicatorum]MDR6241435.1 hypothetical protein [Aureibacter tunicatorum]BDD06720.1 hypothetical protein AUTU_42030 [Aureibacter tunicatorum]